MPQHCCICDVPFVGYTFICPKCTATMVDPSCNLCGGLGEISTHDGLKHVYEECNCVTQNLSKRITNENEN